MKIFRQESSFWLFASLLIVLLGVPSSLDADTFWYRVVNDEVTITGYEGTEETVIVPDTVDGLPVTRIGVEAFLESDSVRSLTLGENLERIEYAAFRDCTNLEEVFFGDALTSIGEAAFSYCEALQNITLPMWLTELGDSAFSGSGLVSIDIPHRVTEIGHYAFVDCYDLSEVVIGDKVASIGVNAFSHCSNLKTISIPDAVTSIGDHAFSSCTGLESVTIGKGLALIDYKAFVGCTNLVRIAFEGDAPALKESVFMGAPNGVVYYTADSSGWGQVFGNLPTAQWYPYTYDIVGEEVAVTGYIGAGRQIELPDEIEGLPVSSIADEAFLDEGNLISVRLSEGISSVGDRAFWGCDRFIGFFTNQSNSTFSSRRGVLFDKEMATLLIYPPGKRGQYYVPGSVSTIADDAFAYTVELATIRFDEGLETIGNRAFLNSSSLESVTLTASVVSLGEQAFAGCPELEQVYFKGNAPVHGDNLFDNGAEQAVVYYELGTTGWESRFGGLPTIEWDPQATYAAWIASYSLDEQDMGLQDDPDHDGQPNGIENLFGTDPTQATAGLALVEISETATTFVHPHNAASANDLVFAYQWSLDLRQFYSSNSYDDAGLTRVEFSTQLDTPIAGLATVTATINGYGLPRSIFVRIQATQDPVF
ncbi:hypothetical protein VDG1235_4694 [Verrucomicrobiia bacterium DG1235]|nr:hypothetical protein VDG1235_4694 [Verrucomicrobiae bacterium DG1235]